MKPYIDDSDFTLYVGDALTTLRGLADQSVDCCISSPPYWGLRDYGTGGWSGGDPDCLHSVGGQVQDTKHPGAIAGGVRPGVNASVCRLCGAVRVDQQLGLEPSPEMFVDNLVAVLREVRRVLADHGTLWLNLGDSYASDIKGSGGIGASTLGEKNWDNRMSEEAVLRSQERQQMSPRRFAHGLKAKDLVGIPWRVAFALQADGWYLRSDIIWSKPNPMPESVADRPTKSHEYIFLLSKNSNYYFDQEAVREAHTSTRWGGPKITQPPTTKYAEATANGFAGAAEALSRPGREWNAYPEGGRNIRTVWEIATQPTPEAHFATYPEELVRRALLAGCPQRICQTCGTPSQRIVEASGGTIGNDWKEIKDDPKVHEKRGGQKEWDDYRRQTMGWTDCGHGNYRPGTVLDPFLGSGTTALVARNHQRKAIGIELSPQYAELCARRLQQLSLLSL